MTTPALCQPKPWSIWPRHDWSVRAPVHCKRCGCLLVPKKAVDDKPEKSKDHHAAD